MTYIYHVRTDKAAFMAVSLLSPQEVFNKGVPSKAVVGTLPENSTKLSQAEFKPNRDFIEFLHHTIAKHAPTHPALQADAKQRGTGWIYIIDNRVADPQGEVEPEDIIGAFEIKAGRVSASTYQAMPKHLLVSKRGIFRLDPFLEGKLLEETRLLLSTQ